MSLRRENQSDLVVYYRYKHITNQTKTLYTLYEQPPETRVKGFTMIYRIYPKTYKKQIKVTKKPKEKFGC